MENTWNKSRNVEEKPLEKIKNTAQEAAKAETSPQPVQRYKALVFQMGVLILLIAFAVVTFFVVTIPSISLDIKITLAIQSVTNPVFAGVMNFVTWVGNSPQTGIISAIIVVILFFFRMRWEAAAVVFASLSATVINMALKISIHRARPTPDLVNVVRDLKTYSFPSGHVMYFTGFFGFIWFLTYILLNPSWMRSLLLVIFGGLVVLVGLSRVYMGEHWHSDTVGAYLLGVVFLIGFIQFYRLGKTRYFVRKKQV